MPRRALTSICALCVLALAAPAFAQTAGVQGGSVTLAVTPTRVLIGKAAVASGAISPASSGEQIEIVNRRGAVMATTTTGSGGVYEVKIFPRKRTAVHARWGDAVSDAIGLRVRPKLSVSLTDVRLFGRARVAGRLRPTHPGESITVRLFRNGSIVRTKEAKLKDGTRFGVPFRIRHPGSYQARAIFNDDDHLRVKRRTTQRIPSLAPLQRGSTGIVVKLLEKRLFQLGYYLSGINRRYDHRTADAVIAFNKVQGRSRVGTVAKSTWRALATPKRARPRSTRRRYHIEVDQTKQVIYLVRRGRVVKILHTSTGADGATRDGVFYVHRKLAGYSTNRLYYPSYFDGLRAIHGWPEVPTYPASHGCARVPMWAAQWIYSKAPLGTQVRIYH